jgi:hypothetical protein
VQEVQVHTRLSGEESASSASESVSESESEQKVLDLDLDRPQLVRLSSKMRKFLEKQRLNSLKAMLRHNAQQVSGNKTELLARIKRCIEYGCLPQCPSCERGHMKEERVRGKRRSRYRYRCPGFMDGTDFHSCGFETDASGLEFPPWKFLPDDFTLGESVLSTSASD